MRLNLRRAAALLGARSGVLRAARSVWSGRAGRLLLLGYHRVRPLGDEAAHCGDVELVSATPEEFAWQVRFVARHFEPITCRQIADAIDGRSSLPSRAVAITFDDGYADFMDFALPILGEEGIPATVFVATDYADSGEPYWFDLVAQMMRLAPRGLIPRPDQDSGLPEGEGDHARAAAAYQLLKYLKNCEDGARKAYLERLHARCSALVAEASRGLGRSMSWDQMREAQAAGIEIGAHSASHPCLARLTPSGLRHELEIPKRLIESQLGVECPSLAYPFGGRSAFSPRVISMAAQLGYRLGVSYIPGVNDLHRVPRFALLRQHVERDTSRPDFEALLSLPELFH